MIWFFRLCTLLLAATILIFSLEPATGFDGPLYADKAQHFTAYGLLSLLIGLGWPNMRLIFVVLIATLFGAGVEFGQGISDLGRTASWLDGLANLAGAIFGALVSAIFTKFYARRSS